MATSYKSDKLPSYACYEFIRNQELGGHCGRMATKSLRVTYECEKAERQYRSVEPENRLVARTLESAWETALASLQKTQEEFRRFEQSTPKQLSPKECEEIRSLSHSLPELWSNSTTSQEDRKKVLRAMIDQIIVTPSIENEDVDSTARPQRRAISRVAT